MYLADYSIIQGSKQRPVEHGACSSTAVAPKTRIPQRHVQMLEFCRDTRPDLSNFEADGVSHISRLCIITPQQPLYISGVADHH